jgi:hypothetical protein
MAQYQCFVDLGSSSTKAVLSDGSEFRAFKCPPLVADMPPSELAIIQAQGEQLGSGLESVSYIQLDPEDAVYALGVDAQGKPNKATSNLPKSALAHLRVLGVIGELAHQYDLDNLSLDVGVALPFNEYLTDYKPLSNKLLAQKTFIYRGREISLDLKEVKVLPEAAGLVQWRKVQLAQQGIAVHPTFAVLMFGHRDLSFLLFREGKPPRGEPSGTERLGYQRVLTAVAQDLPCNSDDPFLYEALISGAGSVAFPSRPGQVYRLTERRDKAKAYYWDLVRHRLDEWFAAVDVPHYEVVISGGVAAQLQGELEEYFEERTSFCTMNWLDDLTHEVASVLDITSEIDQIRFSDCYGGAKWMAIKFRTLEKVGGSKRG